MDCLDCTEEWRPVVGYEGLYEVSNCGRVRSFHATTKVMRLKKSKRGYVEVNLSKNGKKIGFKVHRLVLEAFGRGAGRKLQCRHLDGNPLNNHVGNLAWGTAKENAADRFTHGTFDHRGVRNGQARLTDHDVIEIRDLIAQGARRSEVAVKFGISTASVSMIVSRVLWSHVR